MEKMLVYNVAIMRDDVKVENDTIFAKEKLDGEAFKKKILDINPNALGLILDCVGEFTPFAEPLDDYLFLWESDKLKEIIAEKEKEKQDGQIEIDKE